MPRLERIQLDVPAVKADDFNRLQTAIERALQKLAKDAGLAPSGGGGGGTTIVIGPTGPTGADGEPGQDSMASAAIAGMAQARFWLSTANPAFPYGVDMGALGTGVLQQTASGGVSTPTALNVGTGRIPFGDGSGVLTTTADLSYSAAGGFVVSNASGPKGVMATGSVNGGVNMWLQNTSNQSGAFCSMVFLGDSGGRADVYFTSSTYTSPDGLPSSLVCGTVGSVIFSPAYTRVLRLTNPHAYLEGTNFLLVNAATQLIEKQGGGSFFVGTLGAQLLGLYTNNITRVSIDGTTGGVTLSTLGSGLVKATTGLLAIASASDVAAAIVWPAADRVLVSSGTTTAPVGHIGFEYDPAADVFVLTSSVPLRNYNLGSREADTNYEAVAQFWAANVWKLQAIKKGTGIVRAILITSTGGVTIDTASTSAFTIQSTNAIIQSEQGGTGSLVINGNNSTSNLISSQWATWTFSSVGNANASGDSSRVTLTGSPTKATSVSFVLDAIKLIAGVTFTDHTNNITTATGVNGVTVTAPTYAGDGTGPTITHAASFYVAGAPSATIGLTITNPYAVWIDSGLLRYDGAIALGGGAAATLGTIGGSGPTTAAQNKWIKIIADGTTYFLPLWI